jgi:inorganic phosphate transporter, PiT family
MNQSLLMDGPALFAVCLALLYAFCNGFRDSATVAATVVSTRTLTPPVAFALCAVAEFLGAFLLGAAIASTISKTVLVGTTFVAADITRMLCIGLGVAWVWGMLCWWRGWPTSNGHALLAGLIGAALSIWGPSHVRTEKISAVFLVLIASPLLGFCIAAVVTMTLRWIGERLSMRARTWVNGWHVASCLGVAAAHGSNDGQLILGVLLPLLTVTGGTTLSARLLVAVALAAGVLIGGHRILKKMSLKFYRIRDPQGLSAELTSAGTIFACGIFGFPASTTQVVAGSIIGAGVAQNRRQVKWDFAQEMVLAWVVTFPVVCLVAFLIGEMMRVRAW